MEVAKDPTPLVYCIDIFLFGSTLFHFLTQDGQGKLVRSLLPLLLSSDEMDDPGL